MNLNFEPSVTTRRTIINLLGLKYINVASDWYMSLPWFFQLGPCVWMTIAFICHSEVLQQRMHPILGGCLEVALFTAGSLASFFLWRTVVSDPGFCFEPGDGDDESESEDDGPILLTTKVESKHKGDTPVYGSPHYCPVCGVRMIKYDHHCGIIGACICKYTMGTFILFIVCGCCTCFIAWCYNASHLYLAWPDDAHFKATSKSFWDATAPFRTFVFFINVMLFFASMFSGGFGAMLAYNYIDSVFRGSDCIEIRKARREWRWNSIVDAAEGRTDTPVVPTYMRAPRGWRNVREVLSHFWHQRDAMEVTRQAPAQQRHAPPSSGSPRAPPGPSAIDVL